MGEGDAAHGLLPVQVRGVQPGTPDFEFVLALAAGVLEPSPAAAASAVRADAIWLSGMTKPATATITGAIMSRSLPGCAIRVDVH